MEEQISMFKSLNNIDCTYKSHDLIMSSYDLSVTEQRIITLACKKIKPIYIEKKITPSTLKKVIGAKEFSLVEITVSEFKKEFGLKGNNIYDSLEKYTSVLYDRDIKYFDENKTLFRKRWVSTSKFDRRKGIIAITFNIDMIPDLLVFNGKYVPLVTNLLQEAKGKYVYRIYEILKSSLYLKKLNISVEEFRFMLNIQDKYKQFKELNRKVISPSINTINKISDINIDYNCIRSGGKTKWIEFNISSKGKGINRKQSNFKDKIPSAFKTLNDRLSKYGIELTSEIAEDLFDLAIEKTQNDNIDIDSTGFILEKIDILDNYIIKNPQTNIIGFLKSAIKNNFKSITSNEQTNNYKGFNNFEGRNYTDEDYAKMEEELSFIH